MSRKPSKPETRIEDYLDVMTGGDAPLPQPILRIEFYYAFLAGMTVELPQPILDDEKLLAKICGMEVEAPAYIPGLFPRLYAYMAKKGGQDVQVPDPILRLERYWYDYSAGEAPSVQEYTGAVPVTFVADGTPLLDYIISGNTVQNGTPTPDSPVMPQGTGQRTGNLADVMPFSAKWATVFPNLVTFLNQLAAGNYTLSYDIELTQRNNVSDNSTYGIAIIGAITQNTLRWDTAEVGTIRRVSHSFTISTSMAGNIERAYAYGCGINGVGATGEARISNIMLNLGSTPLPYEPYGYKIPISSANTTTPVYLGEVETTRKVKKLVFDGTETWNKGNYPPTGGYQFFTAMPADIATNSDWITTHFKNGIVLNGSVLNSSAFAIYLSLYPEASILPENATINDLKAWLAAQYAAGTPVTVWYVLATPTTGIVNEPLMKIGDYADTLNMEQAGVQIPTANGSTTLDVETTVKPSEVYIKYRGEAVATLSALSAEVSSPEAITEEENPEETEEEENEC